MKISTWNVNSVNVRLPQLEEWVKAWQPDILGLQELKCEDAKFPLEPFAEIGYHIALNGQRTYNGVALLSRSIIEDVEKNLPGFDNDNESRLIAGTIDGIRVINIYVPNGQSPESDKYRYKLDWLNAFIQYLDASLKKYDDVIVMGDFNIAPTDEDVYNPASWKGKILCTESEREAFNHMLELGCIDALRVFAQPTGLFTWWDYRSQGFEKNHGIRIDHLLLSTYLSRRLISTQVHIDVRANERPSDHAPVSIVLK